MKKFIAGILAGLKDLIYPRICLVCRKRLGRDCVDGLVCSGCWVRIKKNLPPFCGRCGKSLLEKSAQGPICAECLKAERLKDERHFDRAYAPCVYEGPLKELIREFKYNGKDYLARTLAGILIDFILEYSVPVDDVELVIPVPLHPARLRQREFNQAQLLAEILASTYGKMLSSDNLIRTRDTRTQTELDPLDRRENVKGSFSVKNPGLVKGRRILLIDDVTTTGATLSEASFALKNAGSGEVLALTLAN